MSVHEESTGLRCCLEPHTSLPPPSTVPRLYSTSIHKSFHLTLLLCSSVIFTTGLILVGCPSRYHRLTEMDREVRIRMCSYRSTVCTAIACFARSRNCLPHKPLDYASSSIVSTSRNCRIYTDFLDTRGFSGSVDLSSPSWGSSLAGTTFRTWRGTASHCAGACSAPLGDKMMVLPRSSLQTHAHHGIRCGFRPR